MGRWSLLSKGSWVDVLEADIVVSGKQFMA